MRGGYMEQKVWGSCTYCGGTGSELTELGREVLALVSEQREELQDQIDELRRRLDENDEHDRIRAQNYYD